MNVKRICFLGTRTGNFDATVSLFRDVLGLHGVHSEAGWSIFKLPSGRGDFVEVFGREHANSKVFPAEVSEGTVVAFAVDDIVAARKELAAAEVELIGDLVWADELFENPTMEGSAGSFSADPMGTFTSCNRTAAPTQPEVSRERSRPSTAACASVLWPKPWKPTQPCPVRESGDAMR